MKVWAIVDNLHLIHHHHHHHYGYLFPLLCVIEKVSLKRCCVVHHDVCCFLTCAGKETITVSHSGFASLVSAS